MALFDMRINYDLFELNDQDIQTHGNPIAFFKKWLQEAIDGKQEVEPNAMTLATADGDGVPDARMVLCKDVSETGFEFFTNYESKKASDLEVNPRAALVFYWASLHRSVRVSGLVKMVSERESDEYFAVRPRASQLGAWASKQSTSIPNRQVLEDAYHEVEERFKDGVVPRPEFWGGYRLTPLKIEFWQGRKGRLHDRISFTRITPETVWTATRLSP